MARSTRHADEQACEKSLREESRDQETEEPANTPTDAGGDGIDLWVGIIADLIVAELSQHPPDARDSLPPTVYGAER